MAISDINIINETLSLFYSRSEETLTTTRWPTSPSTQAAWRSWRGTRRRSTSSQSTSAGWRPCTGAPAWPTCCLTRHSSQQRWCTFINFSTQTLLTYKFVGRNKTANSVFCFTIKTNVRCPAATWRTVSSPGVRAETSSSLQWCPCGSSISSLSPWSFWGSSLSCSPSPTTRSWPTSTTCGSTPGCTSLFRWTISQTNWLVVIM